MERITRPHNQSFDKLENPFAEPDIRLLVPIDFSPMAYTCMEYAMNLAKACKAKVELLHIVDIQELDEANSALVIHRILDRLEKKAAAQVESLVEIMTENGVEVERNGVLVGQVKDLLIERLKFGRYHFAVMGLNQWNGLARDLARKCNCPVLLLPDNAPPLLPSRPALYSEGLLDESAIHPFLQMIHLTTGELKVISINYRKKNQNVPINGFKIDLNYVQYHGKVSQALPSVVFGLESDFLCFVSRKRHFLSRLFNKDPYRWITKTLVPVLLINQS